MKRKVLPKNKSFFNQRLAPLLLLFVLSHQPAFAWLTYLNSRLDHALYNQYEPRTVVHVTIEKKEVDSVDQHHLMRGPNKTVAYFRVKNVILGQESLKDTLVRIETSSFTWPEDLVPYHEKGECILVLNKYGSDKDYYIVCVVPVYNQLFQKVTTNAEAVPLLEKEILDVLAHEKNPVRQCELIKQVGPVLSKNNAPLLATYATSTNAWLSRSALAAIAYSTEENAVIKLLAADIERFFSEYKENETITNIKGTAGYAPYPYYYQHVFFIEGRSMKEGSRWDENEADRNQRLFNKLVKTGLISQKVQKMLSKN